MNALERGDYPGPFDRKDRVVFSENRLLRKWQEHLPPGSVMIDVGAHFGGSAEWFANQGWKIFAFEPDSENRQILESRFQDFDQVQIDQRAVSDRTENGVPFYVSEESTGISGLSPFSAGHKEVGAVAVTSLSDVCQEQGIDHVDFLKIDTEGYDLMVLKGFPWNKMKPRVIECEFEDRKTVSLGYTFHDLARFLVDKGYTVLVSEWYPIVRYGIQHDWRCIMPYPCELHDANAWGNLIAFLPGQGIPPQMSDFEGTYAVTTGYTIEGAKSQLRVLIKRILPDSTIQLLKKIM